MKDRKKCLCHLPFLFPCRCSPCLTLPLRRRGSDLQPLCWSMVTEDPAATGPRSSPCCAGAFLNTETKGGSFQARGLVHFSEYCCNLIHAVAERVWQIRWQLTEGISQFSFTAQELKTQKSPLRFQQKKRKRHLKKGKQKQKRPGNLRCGVWFCQGPGV